jgi:hypothetical protein
LVDSGFEKGDSLVVWTDRGNNTETFVAQLGAAKAGVVIVTFDEATSQDALDHAIRTTKARGLLFTPLRTISENAPTRTSLIHNLIPDLISGSGKPNFFGELSLSKYPHLRHMI